MNAQSAVDLRREGERLADPLPDLLIEADRISATVALGVHGRRRPGHGETFWEYRRHQREDGAARIDWRRSSRSDALFVRENEWEAAQSVYLWRDGRPGMSYASDRRLPTKKARACILLIALATLLSRGGERVAVLGESAAPRSGRIGLDRTARRLAGGPGVPQAFQAGAVARFGRAVVASDFFEPVETWRERLNVLMASGVGGALVQIVDPSEEDFPFEGRVRFEEPGAPDDLLLGRAQSVRERYQLRFSAQRRALADLARRAGWSFVTSRTDRPATEALLALYTALAEKVRR